MIRHLLMGAFLCVVLSTNACKPRRDQSGVQGVEEDKAQLYERVVSPAESAEMLRPGPGFMQLEGEQRFLHKVRVHGLTKSARWDDLALLSKSSSGDFVLLEYKADLTIGTSQVSWTVPALASFAAPLATRNLLVQLADGFYNFDKTVDVPPAADAATEASTPKRLQYQASVRYFALPSRVFEDSATFLSLDLYSPVAQGMSLADESAGEEKKELPADALGIGEDAPARHRPLYYVKNMIGPQVNGLDLTYGSIFILTHEGQTAGSGFGIWLGADVPRAKLVDKTTSLIVLANPSSDADRDKIRALATAGAAAADGVVGNLIKAQVTAARGIPAFDKRGLVVGGFAPDSGMPIVNDMSDYIARASQKPAQDQKKAPVMGDVKAIAPALPSTGIWKFVQYADGSKWEFYVKYRRNKRAGGKTDVVVTEVNVYQDGYFDVRADSFDHWTSPVLDTSKREAYWWTLTFERNPTGENACAVEYHIFGTPMFGWDSNVRKQGVCK